MCPSNVGCVVQTRGGELTMTCRGLDFDDLLSWPVALLQRCPDLRARLQKRYKHILVDEFQDTNAPQVRGWLRSHVAHLSSPVLTRPDSMLVPAV